MIIVKQIEFENIKDDWIKLENEGYIHTIYQTYDWQRIWWQHYGDVSKKLLLLTAYEEEGNKLVGIAPFFSDYLILKKKIRIFNVIRFIGSRENTYSNFVVDKKYSKQVLNAFFRYLQEKYNSYVLYMTDLPEVDFHEQLSSLQKFFRINVKHASPCPIIYFPQTWEEYWGSLSKTTKKNLKWYKNKLFKNGECKMESINKYSDTDADDLFHLHYQKWGMDSTDPNLAKLEDFEKDIMKMLSRKGWLRMMFLNYKNKRVAGTFMYDYNGKRYFHKGGYNLAFKAMSPGTILILEAIKNAFDIGMNSFDFLGGDEPYKSHFTKSHIQRYSFVAARSYLKTKLFDILLKL